MRKLSVLLTAFAALVIALSAALTYAPPAFAQDEEGVIELIAVQGSQRIEPATIRTYVSVREGDPFDAVRIDRSLKNLFATGLFADVSITRQGGTLLIRVVENPIINRISLEGNSKLKDEDLVKEIQLRARDG